MRIRITQNNIGCLQCFLWGLPRSIQSIDRIGATSTSPGLWRDLDLVRQGLQFWAPGSDIHTTGIPIGTFFVV